MITVTNDVIYPDVDDVSVTERYEQARLVCILLLFLKGGEKKHAENYNMPRLLSFAQQCVEE